jgi:hypothetical protein
MSGKSWRNRSEEEETEDKEDEESFESGRYSSNGADNLSKRLRLSEYFHHRGPSNARIEKFTDDDYSDAINNGGSKNGISDKKAIDKDNNNTDDSDTRSPASDRNAVSDKSPASENLAMGSGKMIGSRIYFEDVYDDFRSGNLNEIRKQQPPYVAKMTDPELENVIAHELHRIAQKEKILKDEYFLFVNIVAGLSHTATSELTVSPTGKGVSGGVGSVVYGAGRGRASATTNVSPLGNPGGVLFSPRLSREGTQPTTPIGRGRTTTSFAGPRKSRDVNNNNNNNTNPDDDEEEDDPTESDRLAREEAERQRSFNSAFVDSLMRDTNNNNNNNTTKAPTRIDDVNIRELLKDPEWKSRAEDWISRNRMYQNLSWMERSDVLGISDMSPILFGPMTSVHSLVQIRGGEAFEDITIDDLVKDDKVRPVYAAAVASQIKVSRTSSTRQHLQVDYQRAMSEVNAAINQIIEGFELDPNSVDPAKKFRMKHGNPYDNVISPYKSNPSVPFTYGSNGFMYPKSRSY